jgi:hypothetical protein
MTTYINPFPPLGSHRVWTEQYLKRVTSNIDKLKWKKYGKLQKVHLDVTPKCSGLYMFVWTSKQSNLTPFDAYRNIVYIGQSTNIRKRIQEYIQEKKLIESYTSSTKKNRIRDNIKVMLTEYKDGLDVYYVKVDPHNIISYEDILIKVFDPIFNTEQRLKENVCNEYENSISAELCNEEEAFLPTMDKLTHNANNNKVCASLGDPTKAF